MGFPETTIASAALRGTKLPPQEDDHVDVLGLSTSPESSTEQEKWKQESRNYHKKYPVYGPS